MYFFHKKTEFLFISIIQEDYDTAIVELTKAFRFDPTNGEALYNLGNAYKKKGEIDQATEVYTKVIELFPNTERARRAEENIQEMNS